MRITAKVDYAVRAATELAAAQAHADPATRASIKGEALAGAQGIPLRFLETILSELRRAGIVGSQRGSEGGYWLARPADSVSVADVIRAVEGPLADVHGAPPEEVDYVGPATDLQRVWIATRVALREVLETTSLADIATGELPAEVAARAARPDGWARR
ncbi:MAG: RrF2 family transcriptional regulator [Acidimicrobiales bacterium]